LVGFLSFDGGFGKIFRLSRRNALCGDSGVSALVSTGEGEYGAPHEVNEYLAVLGARLLQGISQDYCRVHRVAAGAIVNLVAAAGAWGGDQRLGVEHFRDRKQHE
jgi:hypothetical protein